MDRELEFLVMYLEDEFRSYPDVRIRMRQPSTTTRSPDLEQDYDPESQTLHKERGVTLLARGREYYFPSDWAKLSERGKVDAEIRRIKDSYPLS